MKIFYHGGNLDNGLNYDFKQKSVRNEYGPGLYLTSSYQVVKKYVKGNRKLYKVYIEEGNDLNDTNFTLENVYIFLNELPKIKALKIKDILNKYVKNNTIKGYILINILVNHKLLTPEISKKLIKFLVNNNVDYYIINNPFGWGEKMMILYNHKKIEKIEKIDYKKFDFKDLNETRVLNTNYPNIEKENSIMDNEVIRVYHGFSGNAKKSAIEVLLYGLSGKENAKRIYSYEYGNNPKGLFVSVDLKSVIRQFAGSGIIIEFSTKVSDLEAPVWVGGRSYFVQGEYTSSFKNDDEREQQRLKNRERESTNIYPRISQSDRPELAQTLFDNPERQALFIGDLNPNMISHIWFNEGLVFQNRWGKEWVRYKRKDFINKYKSFIIHKTKEYNIYNNKLFKPNENFDLNKIKSIFDNEGYSFDSFLELLKNKNYYYIKHFFWPKQMEQIKKLNFNMINENKNMYILQEGFVKDKLNALKKLKPNENQKIDNYFLVYQHIKLFLTNPTQKDLHNIKTPDDLYKIVDNFYIEKSKPGITFFQKNEKILDLYLNLILPKEKIKDYGTSIHNPINKDIVYEDENILIVKGGSKSKCITYGQGERWCISQLENNYFNTYRLNYNATIYFVLQKNLPKNHHEKLLVILNYGNNQYGLADRTNNGNRHGGPDVAIPWNKIEAQIANLKNKEDYFKQTLITDKEKEFSNLPKITDSLIDYFNNNLKGFIISDEPVTIDDYIREYIIKYTLTDYQIKDLYKDRLAIDALIESGYFIKIQENVNLSINNYYNSFMSLSEKDKRRVVTIKLKYCVEYNKFVTLKFFEFDYVNEEYKIIAYLYIYDDRREQYLEKLNQVEKEEIFKLLIKKNRIIKKYEIDLANIDILTNYFSMIKFEDKNVEIYAFEKLPENNKILFVNNAILNDDIDSIKNINFIKYTKSKTLSKLKNQDVIIYILTNVKNPMLFFNKFFKNKLGDNLLYNDENYKIISIEYDYDRNLEKIIITKNSTYFIEDNYSGKEFTDSHNTININDVSTDILKLLYKIENKKDPDELINSVFKENYNIDDYKYFIENFYTDNSDGISQKTALASIEEGFDLYDIEDSNENIASELNNDSTNLIIKHLINNNVDVSLVKEVDENYTNFNDLTDNQLVEFVEEHDNDIYDALRDTYRACYSDAYHNDFYEYIDKYISDITVNDLLANELGFYNHKNFYIDEPYYGFSTYFTSNDFAKTLKDYLPDVINENKKPYREKKSKNKIYRVFDKNILNEELVWHKDKNDRLITILNENDWKIQFDNELPIQLSKGDKIFIPKEHLHRVIKGNNDLKLIIEELNVEYKNEFDFILKAGSTLFHGTVESFDKRNLKVGGYDEVFWTAKEPIIAQTYISTSGKLYTSTSSILKPSKEKDIQKLQRQIGINYDYNSIEWDGHRPISYKLLPLFRPLYGKYYKSANEMKKIREEIDLLKKRYELYNNKINEIFNTTKNRTPSLIEKIKKLNIVRSEIGEKIYELEIKEREIFVAWSDLDKYKNKFINFKLQKLGYKPTDTNKNNYDYTWVLKTSNSEIKDADYKSKGRLLLVTTTKDMKFFDYTMNGKIEGDLTDLDYHKLDLFRKLENEGYDGIKINDFAQSESEGNLGHTSFGFFKHALQYLKVHSISATHQPYEWGNDNTPEYSEYLKKKLNKKNIEEEVIAYHGSPYNFNKFKTKKIGKGEGAQAFGWGLYFTDIEDIAKWYAETISLNENTIINRLADEYLKEANGDKNKAIEIVNELLKESWSDKKRLKKVLIILETGKKLKSNGKYIYKVSLHNGKTPDQYTWLEWDKPVNNEKIILINKKLEELGIPKTPKKYFDVGFDGRVIAGMNGKELYWELTKIFENNNKGYQKEVSLFLLKNGIDGIKYPAESISKGTTSDTAKGFNYVVFDPNSIKIKEKLSI
jgi:hypothetical protein